MPYLVGEALGDAVLVADPVDAFTEAEGVADLFTVPDSDAGLGVGSSVGTGVTSTVAASGEGEATVVATYLPRSQTK
jgi:hypothetical protein